jgi:hypothetical protein
LSLVRTAQGFAETSLGTFPCSDPWHQHVRTAPQSTWEALTQATSSKARHASRHATSACAAAVPPVASHERHASPCLAEARVASTWTAPSQLLEARTARRTAVANGVERRGASRALKATRGTCLAKPGTHSVHSTPRCPRWHCDTMHSGFQ